SSGVTGAGPIFNAVMLAAERRLGGSSPAFPDAPIRPVPGNVVEREICALSGMAANAWCPLRRREWIGAEAPSQPCHWHHLSDEGLLTFWPPEYRQWARTQGLDEAPRARARDVMAYGASSADDRRVASRAPLTIVSPAADSTYLIDPTLRREFQTLPLRVVASTSGPIEWTVSGRAVGTANADAALDWPLSTGRHRIVARDRQGRTAETMVTVR
ncbi:MAG TPA: hypothetical protein VFO58_25630, partial [Vicinamibacterales bacterium]|nr:hypothetical protein [Vicinamibacterales bacterium]